eukprot:TRINITY_DN2908_c0_g1_i1.p1 TRINITY_DN2908_c0_g1~~TRINITY_DN2908_c0_g1_i1.p1  ORF type:complete len:1073 (+),score=212.36 TRINITY_DN2908_c0_g1_i1:45-3221(+)
MTSQRAMTEVDALLMRLGLDKYKDTLASQGLYTVEDLRQAKGMLVSALPLGPKARLLRELNESDSDNTVPLAAKEYGLLISILKPYIEALFVLTNKLHDASRRNPGGAAARQHIIATTTLKVCEKAIKDSQRYILLSRKHSAQYNADLTSCRVSVGSCVRQLRQQQQQGILKALDEADPVCPLPTLDFSAITIGMIASRVKSPQKRSHSTNGLSSTHRTLDASIIKELRQLRAPPSLVIRTVCVMLKLVGSYCETTWAGAKERLGSAVFLTELANFEEKEVPNSILSEVGDFITDPDTTPEDIKAASVTAGIVAQWIHKVYTSCMMDRNGQSLPADHQSPSPGATSSPGRGYTGNGSRAEYQSESPSPAAVPRSDVMDMMRPNTSWGHSGKTPTDFQNHRSPTPDQNLSSREQFIRSEENRLQQESKRLQALEASLRLREQRCEELEKQNSRLDKATAEPIIKQLDILKGLILPNGGGSHAEDPQLAQKVGQIYRAAATSRALLAHLFDASSAIKKKQQEDMAESNGVAIGSQVQVTKWVPCEVISHHRGRVDVELKDGSKFDALPVNVRRDQEIDESELLPDKYPNGTIVSVGDKVGKVIGTGRGRVGVEFRDGTTSGVIPQRITILTENESLAVQYPIGLEVVIMEDGVITNTARGRLGVTMNDGSHRGVVPPQLKPVEGYLESIYPPNQQVIVKSSNELATVTGTSRGRVGIRLSNGTVTSVMPHDIIRTDSTNEDVFGANNLFQIGSHVKVMSRRGEVCHHARGRLGVVLDADGSTVGVLPCNVRVAELSPSEMQEKYIAGTPVLVGGQYGRVTHCSRGRVGVELKSGETKGVLPSKITILTETQALSRDFPVGTQLQLRRQYQGVVIGSSRGRLGVILEDGTKLGCIPSELSLLHIPPPELYPVGSTVDVKMRGKVTGHHRGRVGVEFPNGVRVGVMPDTLKKCDNPADFPVGTTVKHEGQVGRVTGHSRGRVGIKMTNGDVKGVIPQALEKVDRIEASTSLLRCIRSGTEGKPLSECVDLAAQEHDLLVSDVFELLNTLKHSMPSPPSNTES